MHAGRNCACVPELRITPIVITSFGHRDHRVRGDRSRSEATFLFPWFGSPWGGVAAGYAEGERELKRGGCASGASRLRLAARGSLEVNAVGGVKDAVADGVRGGGIGEVVVPVLGIELAGDDGGPCAVTVFEHFEQVAAFGVRDRGDGEVIDDEHVESSEAGKHLWEAAVGPGEAQLVEQPWSATVGGAEAFATGLVSQCAGEIGFASACCARDEDAMVLLDPRTSSELSQDSLVELSARVAFHAFDAGLREAELGLFECAPDALRFAGNPLSFDEQSEALVEGHSLDVGMALLLVPGDSHAAEAERV
jgi:hypothetical protein